MIHIVYVLWWWWWWYGEGVVRATPPWDARQCMHTAWKISISNSTNRKNSTVFHRKFTPIIAFVGEQEKNKDTARECSNFWYVFSSCVLSEYVPYYSLCKIGFNLISLFGIFLSKFTTIKISNSRTSHVAVFFT